MLSAIDTNVISALWSNEPQAPRVAVLLNEARELCGLVIAAPVHAELMAHPLVVNGFVDRFVSDTGIRVDFDVRERVWRSAGATYADFYAARRRRSAGGEPRRLLVDFLVGAHASLMADRLLTLDSDRYLTHFPDLELVGL